MSLSSPQKHLLVLFCSPHSHGHTRTLLDAFLAPFPPDWRVEVLNLYELNPHPCLGCRACAKQEACRFSDLDGFDRSLRACDLLVVASPVYNDSFPAPMKALLDRCQRYFEARFSLGLRPPVEKRRDAVLLLAMGSGEDFPRKVTCHQLERAFSVMNTSLRGLAVWDNTDQDQAGPAPAQERARSLALEILGDMWYDRGKS